MNAIMMYMSGNSLQIFSIMMVFMLFKGPIQGLINTSTVFAKFETEGTRAKLLGVKAVYILMQFGLLALGVWKVNAMGLLPYVLILVIGMLLLLTGCDFIGLRDQIGWLGSRNGNRWNGPILLLAEDKRYANMYNCQDNNTVVEVHCAYNGYILLEMQLFNHGLLAETSYYCPLASAHALRKT